MRKVECQKQNPNCLYCEVDKDGEGNVNHICGLHSLSIVLFDSSDENQNVNRTVDVECPKISEG